MLDLARSDCETELSAQNYGRHSGTDHYGWCDRSERSDFCAEDADAAGGRPARIEGAPGGDGNRSAPFLGRIEHYFRRFVEAAESDFGARFKEDGDDLEQRCRRLARFRQPSRR